jgi:hypothetical protein
MHFGSTLRQLGLKRFQPSTWNISINEIIRKRTNNPLESYNNLLGKDVRDAHPPLKKLV